MLRGPSATGPTVAIAQHRNEAELGPLRANDCVAWKVTQERVRQAAASFRPALAEEWEDAVQEAQIKVLRVMREKPVPNQRALLGFIRQITYTTCIDQLRRRRIRETLSLEGVDEPPAPASKRPSATLEQAEILRQSSLVLRQLPGECRQLLWMLFQGRSYAELAGVLGETPATIRVRAYRCRRSARNHYLRMTSPVLDVALRLFKNQGFVHTGLDQIAEAAGLSLEQVTEVFSDKPSILWAAGMRMITGDAGVPLAGSDPVEAMRSEPDPHRRLHLAVHMTSERFGRGISDLRQIIYKASQADSQARSLLKQLHRMRKDVSRVMVRNVMRGHPLAARRSIEALAIAAMAIDSSATYRQLREREGCSHLEAVRCIEQQLERALFH